MLVMYDINSFSLLEETHARAAIRLQTPHSRSASAHERSTHE